jgi:hypothetical protein
VFLKYVFNYEQNFSCFDPDYPASGLTVAGLARVYCTSTISRNGTVQQFSVHLIEFNEIRSAVPISAREDAESSAFTLDEK